MWLRYFVFISVLFAPSFARANVFINEIAWMGTTVSANDEWLELYNDGAGEVDLLGWVLEVPDGSPEIMLSGSITGEGYFLLERTDDAPVSGVAADSIYTGALGNGGAHLVLKNTNGNVVDEVDASGGWIAGDNITKDTMQRSPRGWITAHPTPRAINATMAVTPPPPPTPSNSPSVPPPQSIGNSPSVALIPKFTVFGGENKKVAAGTLVTFLGYAKDRENEIMNNVRYLWNFGDGEAKDGRSVTHIYPIPGKYTVGLHVSTGEEVVTHYHLVHVLPNQISIGDVISGDNGFIRFVNPSAIEIDIGGWFVEDGSRIRFAFPANTKLAPQSEIALSNQFSKLLLGNIVYPVTFYFPNGSAALQKFPPIATTSIISTPIRSLGTAHNRANATSTPKPINEVKIINKTISTEDGETAFAENKEASATFQKPDSFSDSDVALVSARSRGNTYLFFAAAVLISIIAAGGFLIVKKFF